MIGLRAFLRSHRKRLALLAVLWALCLALVVEHSGLAQDHMGEAVSMCLAILDGVALLAVGAVALRRRRHRRPPLVLAPRITFRPLAPTGRALALPRAGPPLLQVFLR